MVEPFCCLRRQGLENDRNRATPVLVVRVPVNSVHCGAIGLQDGLCPELRLDGGSVVVDKLLAEEGETERGVAVAQNLIVPVIRGIDVDAANLGSVAKSTNSSGGASLGDGRNVPGDCVGRRQGGVGLGSIECG